MSNNVKNLPVVGQSTIAGTTVQTVNARDLYNFLEIRKDFSDWVKAQIGRARLVENRDYIAVPQKGDVIINDLQGLRAGLDYSILYFLTLEFAKHISMMSGTEKGYEVREYFLECERTAQRILTVPEQLLAQAQALVELDRQVRDHDARLKALEEPSTGYMSVLAYTRIKMLRLPISKMQSYGRCCMALAKNTGARVGASTR